MSRILLDTHVFVWALADRARLPEGAMRVLLREDLSFVLSIASAWELAIKRSQGKIRLPSDTRAFVADGCARARVDLLAVELAHLAEVEVLPPHHRDPFDRMIVAQARAESIPVLTYDRVFDAYDVERAG